MKATKTNQKQEEKIMKAKNQKQVKLADIRQEIRAEKGTVSHCIKVVCVLAETCAQLKSVCPSKKDLLAQAQSIYTDMRIGEQVTTTRCTYTRKCSVDMVIRWLLKNKKC